MVEAFDQVRVKAVLDILRSYRFRYSTEKDLQNGIAKALKERHVLFEPEKEIGSKGEVIDFLVFGGIGIEVKIKGGPSDVARQLIGYAECPEIGAIILVTGRARLGRLPSTLQGKPVHVLSLWGTFL
jgi:hypothetical protein